MATNATLGGVPLLIDPTSVKWTFDVKLAEQRTLGGHVIQIFGTELGDMTVTGSFGNGDRRRGDTAGWEEAERFRQRVEKLARDAAQGPDVPPTRFVMPSKRWAFTVYVKNYTPTRHAVGADNMDYTLTLFIQEDLTGRVVKGVRDRYIQRLMRGIGWEQSEFNGPTAEEAEARLEPYGGSVENMLRQQFTDSLAEGLGGAMSGTSSVPGHLAGREGLEAYLYALRMLESSNNYTAQNPHSTASGAYQYIDSTWGGYKGYSKAYMAPPSVQDERAARDAVRAYDQYQDWAAAATIHFTGRYVARTDPKFNQVPGHWSNKSIAAYVAEIERHMGGFSG